MIGPGAAGALSTIAAIAGLPPTAWLLIAAAGGLGLAIELVFYFRHRSSRHRRRWTERRAGRSQGGGR
ncbi:MAG TPA: hypothetical protein VMT85_18270 [Thermoanaerobaculia bacterium]|nr:hypothetical protein [Thermoanaerobaculia bacterium]